MTALLLGSNVYVVDEHTLIAAPEGLAKCPCFLHGLPRQVLYGDLDF